MAHTHRAPERRRTRLPPDRPSGRASSQIPSRVVREACATAVYGVLVRDL